MTGSLHPSRETLRSFQLLELGPKENARVVRHLLSGCRRCRASLCAEQESQPKWQSGLPVGVAPLRRTEDRFDYGTAFENLFRKLGGEEITVEEDRRQAEALLAELKGHPYDRQRLLIRNSERFESWSLAELLMNSCYHVGFDDPEEAYRLGRLAVRLTAGLPIHRYGANRVADLRGRAWSHLANALRIRTDFRSAERALRVAKKYLESGTGDPLEQARMLDFEASLRISQRRFDTALEHLDETIKIYREHGETHLEGRALVNKGRLYTSEYRIDGAIETLRRALSLIDAERDPRLFLLGKHNLVLSLIESKRPEEAAELLEELRPGYQGLGERMSLLRLRWLEGLIARGVGRREEAELALLEVREAFVRREIGYDAALVSLELATLYAEQGRSSEVRRIAAEMFPVFHSRDVHSEALAAIAVFQQAAERDRATLSVLVEVTDFLKRSRNHPEMQFRRRD